MTWQIIEGDCRDVLAALPEQSAHTCVTSPPYYGLRDYDLPPSTWADGWVGCLGLEPTPEMYVARLVEVFAAVRRVLRDDGTVWLNLGDSYAGSWGAQSRDVERGGQTCERNGASAESPTTGTVAPSLSATQIVAHPKRTNTGSIPRGAQYKPASASSTTARCTTLGLRSRHEGALTPPSAF